ncbi:MAG: leucine--tRNA ligase [Candidatus Saccharibacteria bacterium]|nr:leucine--tRNA ligase [Candidatus Saccharibacteria bacterium]
MNRYDPLTIEKKWQGIWANEKTYAAVDGDTSRPKMYTTEMFPYPSGAGLHVGHVRNFTIVDVLARFYRQQGYNVLRPIGWDTFGLPAENYAIKNNTSPKTVTVTNINHFKEQYQRLGMAVDWDREINTSDPEYYHWTQWCFEQLFKHGLAYQQESYQWWCPVDKTVLANEQVEGSKCWRCGTEVEKKKMNQWFFKITDYADELLNGLDEIDWPAKIKTMQRNWIGRSQGAEVEFRVDGHGETIRVFTTRPDTLFGVTFLVLAPEHKLVNLITTADNAEAVHEYCHKAIAKSEIDRQANHDKTGVFTGVYAINPANGAKMPIWVADYVLGGYGEGAVMAVPAHDQRDYDFAKKFDLPIIKVIDPTEDIDDDNVIDSYSGEGKLINSGDFNGTPTSEAREQIVAWLEQQGIGNTKVTYKMRDWLISRQRYWGCPIPIIHCPHCGAVPVPEDQLPVMLPDIDDYQPSGDGRSPLAKVDSWVNTTCPHCGRPAKRETDTMDGYACSSWYLFRYTDARNDKQAWSSDKVNFWAPLDYYVGGDHAVAHLLYVRFWTKFFQKLGYLGFGEPVKHLLYNGYINAPDGAKMSKSKGNVVDPLDVIDSGYGADTLRVYEMFIGPYDQDAAWSTGGIGGSYRFLNRCWTLVGEFLDSDRSAELGKATTAELLKLQHTAIKRVTDDIYNNQFNTAISALMEYLNGLTKIKSAGFDDKLWRQALSDLCQLLAPFAPHIANEMYARLHDDNARIDNIEWPKCNEQYLVTDTVTIAVQVNGRLRGEVNVDKTADQEKVETAALAVDNVARFISGKDIVKKIYVKDKILNIVVE